TSVSSGPLVGPGDFCSLPFKYPLTGICPSWHIRGRGIRIRSPRRTEPPRHPHHALRFGALGGRADAPPSPAAAVGLQAPQGLGWGCLRRLTRGCQAAGLSPQPKPAPGPGRMARAIPPLLVEARRCPGRALGADGEGLTRERKEAMTSREEYTPGP